MANNLSVGVATVSRNIYLALSSAGAVGAPGQQDTAQATGSGLARAFLESLGLEIYAGAFELAGYDSELHGLTQWDLDNIERQSHVPILPMHRERILQASCNYVVGIICLTKLWWILP